jgi:hypothetical protein
MERINTTKTLIFTTTCLLVHTLDWGQYTDRSPCSTRL